MNDIYKSIEDYNPNKKPKILIVDIMFHNMIVDKLSNKTPNPVVTKLFIRGRKLNISLVFITQSYFVVPKYIRLNSKHYFILEIPNKKKKRKSKQIASHNSLDIDCKNFMYLAIIFFLVIDSTLASDNPSPFRKNIKTNIKIINDKISDEKMEYNINRETAKILAL